MIERRRNFASTFNIVASPSIIQVSITVDIKEHFIFYRYSLRIYSRSYERTYREIFGKIMSIISVEACFIRNVNIDG